MTSHGVPRVSNKLETKSPEARERERQKIKEYRDLESIIGTKVRQARPVARRRKSPLAYLLLRPYWSRAQLQRQEFTQETLKVTSKLLKLNPEYYTIWNNRRLILQHLFEASRGGGGGGGGEQNALTSAREETDSILDLIDHDLNFLIPLLLEYPKCYWIWNHRLWLLDQSTKLLPLPTARQIWQAELVLVGKMLTRDNRNFHGWGYRRKVVASLENPELNPQDQKSDSSKGTASSMAEEEFDYTTKMVKTSLSNFSAWHNRTKLIIRLLDERNASDAEREKWLRKELEFIHNVLFAPDDQSLWFYHQNLMCTFDPKTAANSIAPNLSNDQRLQYIQNEIDFIAMLLDMTEDCKWIYQALIENTMLLYRVRGSVTDEEREDLQKWLQELKKLDPLRRGRWLDLEKQFDV